MVMFVLALMRAVSVRPSLLRNRVRVRAVMFPVMFVLLLPLLKLSFRLVTMGTTSRGWMVL